MIGNSSQRTGPIRGFMSNYQTHPGYDGLPAPIKMMVTAEEYAWMNDGQRVTLVERACLPDPEPEEDD